jgi:heavy metal translocating P-type ATPase
MRHDNATDDPIDLARGGASFELLTRDRQIEIARIILTGIIIFLHWRGLLTIWWLWAAVAIGLYPLAKTGILDFIHERKIGTEIFVTIAALIALLGGEPVAGAVLLVIILIAEFIAEFNTERARASIRAVIGSVPQTALVRSGTTERTVPIAQLKLSDVVLIRAGDRIPIDGRIVTGNCSINEAPITGESNPKDKGVGDDVFAGTIVESGACDAAIEKLGEDTTYARIVKLVEKAEESQAPIQKLADKVAAWLIPVVFVFVVIVFLVTRDVRKIVALMIFTSPAELGLATPMVMIAAVARAARSGILIKGGVYLELLAKVNAFVFDKTGTLTEGKPRVQRVDLLDKSVDEKWLVRKAAATDRRSGHPLAKAVVQYAAEIGVDVPEPQEFASLQGRGVKATVDGHVVLVGNKSLLKEHNIVAPEDSGERGMTTLYVVVDNSVTGLIQIADQVRPGARETIEKLRAAGVTHIAMLTGDNRTTAETVASQIGIDQIFAELLPEAKLKAIDELQRRNYRVAMVGDGINDAPALAKADVGIAMGVGGTQAALEAADVALMTNDLLKLVTGRLIARRSYRTIQENLIFGVGVVHLLGITAALLSWIGPIQAALIHLGPDVLVFLIRSSCFG